jgi:hypothetical protein
MFSRLFTSAATPAAVFLDLRATLSDPYAPEPGEVPIRLDPAADRRLNHPDMTEGLSSLDRPTAGIIPPWNPS